MNSDSHSSNCFNKKIKKRQMTEGGKEEEELGGMRGLKNYIWPD